MAEIRWVTEALRPAMVGYYYSEAIVVAPAQNAKQMIVTRPTMDEFVGTLLQYGIKVTALNYAILLEGTPKQPFVIDFTVQVTDIDDQTHERAFRLAAQAEALTIELTMTRVSLLINTRAIHTIGQIRGGVPPFQVTAAGLLRGLQVEVRERQIVLFGATDQVDEVSVKIEVLDSVGQRATARITVETISTLPDADIEMLKRLITELYGRNWRIYTNLLDKGIRFYEPPSIEGLEGIRTRETIAKMLNAQEEWGRAVSGMLTKMAPTSKDVQEIAKELSSQAMIEKMVAGLQRMVRPDGRLSIAEALQGILNDFTRLLEEKGKVLIFKPTEPSATANTKTIVCGYLARRIEKAYDTFIEIGKQATALLLNALKEMKVADTEIEKASLILNKLLILSEEYAWEEEGRPKATVRESVRDWQIRAHKALSKICQMKLPAYVLPPTLSDVGFPFITGYLEITPPKFDPTIDMTTKGAKGTPVTDTFGALAAFTGEQWTRLFREIAKLRREGKISAEEYQELIRILNRTKSYVAAIIERAKELARLFEQRFGLTVELPPIPKETGGVNLDELRTILRIAMQTKKEEEVVRAMASTYLDKALRWLWDALERMTQVAMKAPSKVPQWLRAVGEFLTEKVVPLLYPRAELPADVILRMNAQFEDIEKMMRMIREIKAFVTELVHTVAKRVGVKLDEIWTIIGRMPDVIDNYDELYSAVGREIGREPDILKWYWTQNPRWVQIAHEIMSHSLFTIRSYAANAVIRLSEYAPIPKISVDLIRAEFERRYPTITQRIAQWLSTIIKLPGRTLSVVAKVIGYAAILGLALDVVRGIWTLIQTLYHATILEPIKLPFEMSQSELEALKSAAERKARAIAGEVIKALNLALENASNVLHKAATDWSIATRGAIKTAYDFAVDNCYKFYTNKIRQTGRAELQEAMAQQMRRLEEIRDKAMNMLWDDAQRIAKQIDAMIEELRKGYMGLIEAMVTKALGEVDMELQRTKGSTTKRITLDLEEVRRGFEKQLNMLVESKKREIEVKNDAYYIEKAGGKLRPFTLETAIGRITEYEIAWERVDP
jgi:tetrahydromethanopterin S-methyltransferase subunit G